MLQFQVKSSWKSYYDGLLDDLAKQAVIEQIDGVYGCLLLTVSCKEETNLELFLKELDKLATRGIVQVNLFRLHRLLDSLEQKYTIQSSRLSQAAKKAGSIFQWLREDRSNAA